MTKRQKEKLRKLIGFKFESHYKYRLPRKRLKYLEEIMEWKQPLLDYVDVLVDGPFVNELKDANLKFRGSSNQRIIDIKKTKENKNITLVEFKEI